MKTAQPYIPDEDNYIFTEGIDYAQTESVSIWGAGDLATLEFLKTINIHGTWLNLAAGDGRYNAKLLEKVSRIVAADIDESALDKLWRNTPPQLRAKLQTKAFNITEKFPFADNSFDGVFCTGTLHLFPKKILAQIFGEIGRVLTRNGSIIIDFATDVKHVLPDGRLNIKKSQARYCLTEAAALLRELLQGYTIHMIESAVPPETIKTGDMVYQFSCKFILLRADKK